MRSSVKPALLAPVLVLLGVAVLIAASSPCVAEDVSTASRGKIEVATVHPGPVFLTDAERAKAATAGGWIAPPVSTAGGSPAVVLSVAGSQPKAKSWGTVGPALPPAVVTARLRAKLEALARSGR